MGCQIGSRFVSLVLLDPVLASKAHLQMAVRSTFLGFNRTPFEHYFYLPSSKCVNTLTFISIGVPVEKIPIEVIYISLHVNFAAIHYKLRFIHDVSAKL